MANDKEFTDIDVSIGDFRVILTHLDEGLSGEYDPEDPSDARMIRFDTYKAVQGDPGVMDWDYITDGSYCTALSVDTPTSSLLRFCGMVLDALKTERPRLAMELLTHVTANKLV